MRHIDRTSHFIEKFKNIDQRVSNFPFGSNNRICVLKPVHQPGPAIALRLVGPCAPGALAVPRTTAAAAPPGHATHFHEQAIQRRVVRRTLQTATRGEDGHMSMMLHAHSQTRTHCCQPANQKNHPFFINLCLHPPNARSTWAPGARRPHRGCRHCR